jgi:trehalose 6-phosphate synthase/phosphatase
MVWIHDIYLLLTPFYLKRKLLNSNIGFFIHSPFPSSDIFSTFQYRTEILKSLLCCDVIGFHLFEYARNFFTACRKILELYTINKKGGFLGIEYNGRTILLNVNHIGINQDTIKQMVASK